MKRRGFLQSLFATPAAAVAIAKSEASPINEPDPGLDRNRGDGPKEMVMRAQQDLGDWVTDCSITFYTGDPGARSLIHKYDDESLGFKDEE